MPPQLFHIPIYVTISQHRLEFKGFLKGEIAFSPFAILGDKIKFPQLLRDSKLAQDRVRRYTKSVN